MKREPCSRTLAQATSVPPYRRDCERVAGGDARSSYGDATTIDDRAGMNLDETSSASRSVKVPTNGRRWTPTRCHHRGGVTRVAVSARCALSVLSADCRTTDYGGARHLINTFRSGRIRVKGIPKSCRLVTIQ